MNIISNKIKILIKNNEIDAAIGEINFIQESDFFSFNDGLSIAHSLNRVNRTNEAIKILDKTIVDRKSKIGISYQQGIYSMEINDYVCAISKFKYVLETEKEFKISYCSAESTFLMIICFVKLKKRPFADLLSTIDDKFKIYYEGNMLSKKDLINMTNAVNFTD